MLGVKRAKSSWNLFDTDRTLLPDQVERATDRLENDSKRLCSCLLYSEAIEPRGYKERGSILHLPVCVDHFYVMGAST